MLHCVDLTCGRCRAARAGTPGVGDHTGSASGSAKPRPHTGGEKIAELTNDFCSPDHAKTAPKSGLEREFPATLQI
jgi:hypothetical protein